MAHWDRQKKQLIKDLKRFGLNPRDWSFQKGLKGKNQPQVLVHKKDPSFSILGVPVLKSHFSQWQDITVLSI